MKNQKEIKKMSYKRTIWWTEQNSEFYRIEWFWIQSSS